MCVCVCVCMCVCVCVCVFTHICGHRYTYITNKHTHIYKNIHTHTGVTEYSL